MSPQTNRNKQPGHEADPFDKHGDQIQEMQRFPACMDLKSCMESNTKGEDQDVNGSFLTFENLVILGMT